MAERQWVLIYKDGIYQVQKQSGRELGSFATRADAQQIADWVNDNLETMWPDRVSTKPKVRAKPKTKRSNPFTSVK